MSVIYFIACDTSDLVKVGFAVSLKRRFACLQTGCPFDLSVLASFPGSWAFERDVHRALADARVRGEWFYRPQVEPFIEDARENGISAAVKVYTERLSVITEAKRKATDRISAEANPTIAAVLRKAVEEHGLDSISRWSGMSRRKMARALERGDNVCLENILSLSAALGDSFTSEWLKPAGQGARMVARGVRIAGLAA